MTTHTVAATLIVGMLLGLAIDRLCRILRRARILDDWRRSRDAADSADRWFPDR